jgi:hypothetical protein
VTKQHSAALADARNGKDDRRFSCLLHGRRVPQSDGAAILSEVLSATMRRDRPRFLSDPKARCEPLSILY